MRTYIRGVLACTLLVSLSSISLAVDFGRTAGAFGVSPAGSVAYTVPIWTPPGPNAVTPPIRVEYNSQGGNSLVGVGWNLAATSLIERCARTKAQDGDAAAVDLTLNDRFCING